MGPRPYSSPWKRQCRCLCKEDSPAPTTPWIVLHVPCLPQTTGSTSWPKRVAAGLENMYHWLLLYHHRQKTATVGTRLETFQAYQYKADHSINDTPTTTGAWLFQVISYTPSQLQLHQMSVLRVSTNSQVPLTGMPNLQQGEGKSWNI